MPSLNKNTKACRLLMMFNFLKSGNTIFKMKGVLDLSEDKQPYKTLTSKNNGLSAAQEVLYAEDFKDADKATQKNNNKKSDK